MNDVINYDKLNERSKAITDAEAAAAASQADLENNSVDLSEEDKKKKEEEEALKHQGAGEGDLSEEDKKKKEEEEALKHQGAGEVNQSDEDKKKQADAEAAAELAANALLFKRYGVKNMAELDAKFTNPQQAVELSEEEKNKQADANKAAVNKYAVDKGIMSTSDITNLEIMRKKSKEDLVFDDFANTYREENKGRKDDDNVDDPITEEEIREAFESAYNLKSANKTVKGRGERMLNADADKIISSLESKYKSAEEEFVDVQQRGKDIVKYKTFVKEFLSDGMPAEFAYGKGDDKVVFKFDEGLLTADEKNKIEKFFVNEAYFQEFRTGESSQKTHETFKKRLEDYLKLNFHDKIVETASSVMFGAGLKKGKTGSKEPFSTKKDQQEPVSTDETVISPEDRAKTREMYGGR